MGGSGDREGKWEENFTDKGYNRVFVPQTLFFSENALWEEIILNEVSLGGRPTFSATLATPNLIHERGRGQDGTICGALDVGSAFSFKHIAHRIISHLPWIFCCLIFRLIFCLGDIHLVWCTYGTVNNGFRVQRALDWTSNVNESPIEQLHLLYRNPAIYFLLVYSTEVLHVGVKTTAL